VLDTVITEIRIEVEERRHVANYCRILIDTSQNNMKYKSGFTRAACRSLEHYILKVFLLFAIDDYQAEDTLYTWAKSGTLIYS